MNAPIPLPVPSPPTGGLSRDQLKAPTCLLMGPAGSGKTYSLATLLEAGLETFVIGTEPNFLDTLLDSCRDRGLKLDKLHWHYIAPAAPDMQALEEMALKISTQSYEGLSNMKSGISKEKTTQYREFLALWRDFIDEKDGQHYGSIFDFPPDTHAVAIDSLSGMNTMALDLMIGMKPTAAQGEWGVAMNLEEKSIQKLTSDLKCMFVLTAHIGREPDEVSGGKMVMMDALGTKLAPKLGKQFSEIILSRRGATAKEFRWSTFDPGVVLKNRSLPISKDLDPSFALVWSSHKRRVAQLTGATP